MIQSSGFGLSCTESLLQLHKPVYTKRYRAASQPMNHHHGQKVFVFNFSCLSLLFKLFSIWNLISSGRRRCKLTVSPFSPKKLNLGQENGAKKTRATGNVKFFCHLMFCELNQQQKTDWRASKLQSLLTYQTIKLYKKTHVELAVYFWTGMPAGM